MDERPNNTIVPPHKLRSASNRRITKGLFQEFAVASQDYICFTTDRWDKKPTHFYPEGLKSFPKLYLEYCVKDPTEYEFAMALLGDWEHWLLMVETDTIGKLVESLRKEVAVAIKSKAMLHIANEVDTKTKNAYAAAKWLAENGWEKEEAVSEVKRKRKERKEAEDKDSEDIKNAEFAKGLLEELNIAKPN